MSQNPDFFFSVCPVIQDGIQLLFVDRIDGHFDVYPGIFARRINRIGRYAERFTENTCTKRDPESRPLQYVGNPPHHLAQFDVFFHRL